MSNIDLITDVRLTAIESLLQKLYGMFLAGCSSGESVGIKQQLLKTAGKWEIYHPAGPQDVAEIEQRMKLVEIHTRTFLEIAEKQEEVVRGNKGLPLANLPDGSFDAPFNKAI